MLEKMKLELNSLCVNWDVKLYHLGEQIITKIPHKNLRIFLIECHEFPHYIQYKGRLFKNLNL